MENAPERPLLIGLTTKHGNTEWVEKKHPQLSGDAAGDGRDARAALAG